ncbi:MAG: MBOAT family protein [Tannerellaceae bacterium]|nr:MBOAT family protein [Tannerellaceae bacterium]
MNTTLTFLQVFENLSFEKLEHLLQYKADEPLLFTSGLFLYLFIAFLLFYIPLRKQITGRIIYVTFFSIYFYYLSSGKYFFLILLTATSDFLIGQMIDTSNGKLQRKGWVTLSLVINLGMLGYFKYYNFLLSLLTQSGRQMGEFLGIERLQEIPFERVDIVLPVGISFFTFQSLSYIIDIYRQRITPLRRWIDYVFYVSFFPQLVAGPIVRARDFIPQIYKELKVTHAQFGEGLFLALCGLFKKAVIADYISSNFVDRVFEAPLLYSGLENLMGVYGYALQIYCDFSGYSDMAIGIALLLGFRFNINFDSPYQSATITEFWRRWHISLSSWLKDYLYISLGGNRKGKKRTYLNLFITMLLGGLWHGAAIRFIIWGAFHGVALAIHKYLMGLFNWVKPVGSEMNPVSRMLGIVITFHLVCFSWIFFRAENMTVVGEMLSQIWNQFHPEIFFQFIEGYKWVCLFMAIGFVLHFIPGKVAGFFQKLLTDSPLLLQVFFVVLMIFIIVQVKSAGVQSFIYFQF